MNKRNFHKNLPDTPGVYLMKDAAGHVLYIGKAANLKRRVSSYFLRPHDARIERLVAGIEKIDYKTTDTALEALILEAELIKKLRPPFNIKEKDDKSFLYVEITQDKFPRILLVRGKDMSSTATPAYGPFTSASSIREALRILRKIFPWSMHQPEKLGKFARPCLEYEINLCPGTCIGAISRADYLKNIRNAELFFEGGKKKILRSLEKDMTMASKKLEFEKAGKLRRQIFALQHIRDVALISDDEERLAIGNTKSIRIEGYDISNISGTSAVGSMVVFAGGAPDKNEYRKFKIRIIAGSDLIRRHPLSVAGGDVGMLKEILRRRFQRTPPAGGW
ncbi:MAG: GIY-YIG nuclease family protein, partial [bacterium]|nr:GIY-YIG nuclease family protein [bacterium]